jgi:TolA-binding protein
MEEMRRHLLIQKKTLDLLPDGEENVKRLRELADRSAQRLMILATQWETVRAPLIERYRKLKLQFSDRKSNAQRLLMEMKKMREQMLGLADGFRQQDSVYKQLASVFGAMPSNISREVYTDRIVDIVRQVKKQKVDIDKILRDTRDLQQEVNTISGTLDRSFAVAQELVFQYADSTKDTLSKEAYRLVVGIHQDFGALAVSVHERGQVRNKILQTEERIETMGKRIEALRLEQVQSDLEKMETANRALCEQLEKAGADMSAFSGVHTRDRATSTLIRMDSSAAVSTTAPAVACPSIGQELPVAAAPPVERTPLTDTAVHSTYAGVVDELEAAAPPTPAAASPTASNAAVGEAVSTASVATPTSSSSASATQPSAEAKGEVVVEQAAGVAEVEVVAVAEEEASAEESFSDPLGVDPLGVGAT